MILLYRILLSRNIWKLIGRVSPNQLHLVGFVSFFWSSPVALPSDMLCPQTLCARAVQAKIFSLKIEEIFL